MLTNQLSIINKQVSVPRLIKKNKVFSACFFVRATCRTDVKLWSWPGELPSLKLRNWTQFETSLEAKCSPIITLHLLFFWLCGLIFHHELKPELIQWSCQCQDTVFRNTCSQKVLYCLLNTFISDNNSYIVLTFNIFFKGLHYSIMYPHITLSSC